MARFISQKLLKKDQNREKNRGKLARSVKDPNRPNRLLCAAEKEISNVEPS
jgi:hypothetical protein